MARKDETTMLYILQTALELGFLYAPVALALFLSYRILDLSLIHI